MAGRTVALVVAAVVVVGVGILSLALPTPTPTPAPSSGDGVQVAPTDAHVSSLFCASGAGLDAGVGATGTVILTNTSGRPAHGVMTVADAASPATVRQRRGGPGPGTADLVPATRVAGRRHRGHLLVRRREA